MQISVIVQSWSTVIHDGAEIQKNSPNGESLQYIRKILKVNIHCDQQTETKD